MSDRNDSPLVEISVVIGGNEELIFGCVESIFDTWTRNVADIAVHVIANPASPSTVTRLKEKHPDVTIWQNSERKGFAENHNMILRSAKSRYVAIVNDDTLFHPGALESLIDYMEANSNIGIIGPQLLNGDGSIQPSTYSFPTLPRSLAALTGIRQRLDSFGVLLRAVSKILYRKPGQSRFWDHDAVCDVDTLKGACLVVRTAAVRQVGPLDEVTLMYGEETEWAYRFAEKQWRVVFFPDAKVTHFGKQSAAKLASPVVLQEKVKGYLNMFEKHGSRIRYFVFRVSVFVLFGLLFLRAKIRGEQEPASVFRRVLKFVRFPQLVLGTARRYG
jgi:GT2 family glycosyltransferase